MEKIELQNGRPSVIFYKTVICLKFSLDMLDMTGFPWIYRRFVVAVERLAQHLCQTYSALPHHRNTIAIIIYHYHHHHPFNYPYTHSVLQPIRSMALKHCAPFKPPTSLYSLSNLFFSAAMSTQKTSHLERTAQEPRDEVWNIVAYSSTLD